MSESSSAGEPWSMNIESGLRMEREKHEEIEADYIILAAGRVRIMFRSKDPRMVIATNFWTEFILRSTFSLLAADMLVASSLPIYRAFGCQVTLAEKSERLLPSWDENVGAYIAHRLTADWCGYDCCDRNIPVHDLPTEEGRPIIAKADGTKDAPDDLLLVATSSQPNTQSLGLAELGIPFDAVY